MYFPSKKGSLTHDPNLFCTECNVFQVSLYPRWHGGGLTKGQERCLPAFDYTVNPFPSAFSCLAVPVGDSAFNQEVGGCKFTRGSSHTCDGISRYVKVKLRAYGLATHGLFFSSLLHFFTIRNISKTIKKKHNSLPLTR